LAQERDEARADLRTSGVIYWRARAERAEADAKIAWEGNAQAQADLARARQHIAQLLSLHDDPCPYDAATTRSVARAFLAERAQEKP
jgi:hypothetical protein